MSVPKITNKSSHRIFTGLAHCSWLRRKSETFARVAVNTFSEELAHILQRLGKSICCYSLNWNAKTLKSMGCSLSGD